MGEIDDEFMKKMLVGIDREDRDFYHKYFGASFLGLLKGEKQERMRDIWKRAWNNRKEEILIKAIFGVMGDET